MTTHIARKPYTPEELKQLYPSELELQLVQVLLRHGERTPVSPRFQNTGLQPYWAYCNSAKQFAGVIMGSKDLDGKWDTLKYRRRIETFGQNDEPIIASGPNGEFDAVCQPGELTDLGRATTLALGQRLRHLYIDQLHFMPALIASSDMIYLRATPIKRALESVQQAFWGMYPLSARTADFPTPTIITRTPADETLFPNDGNCRRFAHLSRAFAARAAQKWNETEDMEYLTGLFGRWMPNQAPVKVDSHPRLSGIMDTINATHAHGPDTKLPKEFYDEKAREIIDRIAVEEWYAGYTVSREYRTLGIGGLMGDIVHRMVSNVEHSAGTGVLETGGENGDLGKGRGGETNIKFAMSGCHDTTLAGVLNSLGAFEGEKWPPFTSHIALELFREKGAKAQPKTEEKEKDVEPKAPVGQMKGFEADAPQKQGWWTALFGAAAKKSETKAPAQTARSDEIGRKSMEELSEKQKAALQGYYVRIRYNDKIMQVPGCKIEGNHLKGDTTFCTLEAFKAIVDKYTPKNWKHACASNLDAPSFPEKVEPAGY